MIIVIGEALIDLIESRGEPATFQAVVGGANANVAIALARRSTPQQFLARISSDSFGQKIRHKLESNGVGLEHAISINEPTTLAIASVSDSGSASYSFYVQGTADWGWTESELPTDVVLENLHAKALQFGCLTMAMPPGNKVIEDWARFHFEQDSITISHDLNVRPGLGFEKSSEKKRVERINQISHIIKASDDDIHWLYDMPIGSDLDQVAWGWIGDSDRLVFITRGEAGVSIYRKNKTRLDIESRKTNVQDTVGAGDTFCANLLGELFDLDALGENPFDRLANLTNEQLEEVAKIAAVAASIACEKTGAEPPTLEQLHKVLSA